MPTMICFLGENLSGRRVLIALGRDGEGRTRSTVACEPNRAGSA